MQSSLLKTMVAVAKAHHIPVVDCGQFFPSKKYSFYYLDPVHPNAQGTPYVAEAIFRYLESSTLTSN
jgi:lysophospholipase L1-like esterase